MNENDQEFMEVAGADDDLIPDAEVAKTPLKLTPEILKRDQRKTDIVEIDLNTGAARVVEKSEAPKLTKKVLKEKGARVHTVEIIFDGDVMEVEMMHGKSLALDIAHEELLDAYKDKDLTDPNVLTERDTAVKRLLLSGMVLNPIFSCQGEPADGHPIEDVSQILLDALWNGYCELHFPLKENWYQVKVLRGIPLETMNLIGKTFEAYPADIGMTQENYTPEEITAMAERHTERREVIVASMLLDPALSLNGESQYKHPYPIEDLSEHFLQMFFNAYRVSNVPKAGYEALRTFRRSGNNGLGESSDTGDTADVKGL